MGIRWLKFHWDVYNVILGDSSFGKRGLMGEAFDTLLSYAQNLKSASISLQVLKCNPAVGWYQKHGFRVVKNNSDYLLMTFQRNSS